MIFESLIVVAVPNMQASPSSSHNKVHAWQGSISASTAKDKLSTATYDLWQ
jgi:hypothetical protein